MSEKQSKAKEILWLAVALMSIFAAVHKTINHSFGSSWYFYLFTLISLLMYAVWRNKRLNDN
jgi:hypothetical protein